MIEDLESKLTHFPKKCIIMDFDGTLIDSMKLFEEMWSYAFFTLDPSIDKVKFSLTINECLGQSAEYTRSEMLQTFNFENRAEEAKELRARFRENADYTKYEITETKNLLNKISDNGFIMFVHSNGDNQIDKDYALNAGIDNVITNTSFPRKELVKIFTNSN